MTRYHYKAPRLMRRLSQLYCTPKQPAQVVDSAAVTAPNSEHIFSAKAGLLASVKRLING
jgi:hypothetical protein